MNSIILSSYLVVILILCSAGQVMAGGEIIVAAESGIVIWLDEQLKGQVAKGEESLVLRDVDAGAHILKASKSGYDPVSVDLNVEENRAVRVAVSMASPALVSKSITAIKEITLVKESATLVARSIPPGATVFLNGKKMGESDLLFNYVKPGKYNVRFDLDEKSFEEDVVLHVNEERLIKADFSTMKISGQEITSDDGGGEAVMVLQTARARKPAVFSHRKHQEMFDCGECHHARNDAYEQLPYVDGMKIQKCVTCHNSSMPNKKFNHFKLAAHARCKGCHKAKAADAQKTGPIIRCGGCHDNERVKELRAR